MTDSNNNVYILDDRHQVFNQYKSQCATCKHLIVGGYSCPAYPDGIPDSLLEGDQTHNKVHSGQKGDFVFARRDR